MIDRDDDDILMLRQACAIVANRAACALIKTAAVKPDHHRSLAPVTHAVRPHVEVKAILAGVVWFGRPKHFEELALLLATRTIRLWGVMPELECIAHTRP